MSTERILIELGSQVLQVVTQILYNQEICTLTHTVSNVYSCKIKNLIKFLYSSKTRGDYMHKSAIN